MNYRPLVKVVVLLVCVAWIGGATYWYECTVYHDCSKNAPSATAQDVTQKDVASDISTAKNPALINPKNQKNPADHSSTPAIPAVATIASSPTEQTNQSTTKQTSAKQTDQETTPTKIAASTSNAPDEIPAAVSVVMPAEIPAVTPAAMPSHSGETSSASNDAVIGSKKRIIIYFPTDKITPKEMDKNNLAKYQALIKQLQTQPQDSVLIVGYSDTLGNVAYNQQLSMKRAMQVKEMLVGQGINEQKIEIISKGTDNPASSNSTRLGRNYNRRVEVYLKPHNM